MYLERYLRPYFPPRVRENGYLLYDGLSVEKVFGDRWDAAGEVIDNGRFTAEISRQNYQVNVYCDCEGWMKQGVCSHIWALILAADAKGLLMGRMGGALAMKRAELSEDNILDAAVRRLAPPPPPPPPPPAWQALLTDVKMEQVGPQREEEAVRAGTEFYYLIDHGSAPRERHMWVGVEVREKLQSGNFGKLKTHRLKRSQIHTIENQLDREIVGLFAGPRLSHLIEAYGIGEGTFLSSPLMEFLLPRMCETGRCLLRLDRELPMHLFPVLSWDESPPWKFQARMTNSPEGFSMRGEFVREAEVVGVTVPQMLFSNGLMVLENKICRYGPTTAMPWISSLRIKKEILIPQADGERFQKELLLMPAQPNIEWPEELRFEEAVIPMQPNIHFMPPSWSRDKSKLNGTLTFKYDVTAFPWDHPQEGVFVTNSRQYVRRDRAAEQAATNRLLALGLKVTRNSYGTETAPFETTSKRLPGVVRELVKEGWQVEAEGKLFRSSTSFNAQLTSGLDWFDLEGSVNYETGSIELPALIKALEKGETLVELSDGSYGMIPEDFMAKYGMLFTVGRVEGAGVRYSKTQAGLLDVFLAERESEIKVDAGFRASREKLRNFKGVMAMEQPAGFHGELRGYQCEGLGWLNFLQETGWGGCLADDMGVGKTAQVLALLENRRVAKAGPSLVVVPRSLVYNWQREAAQFTPALKLMDNTGPSRVKDTAEFNDFNVIMMTYGTLRSDAIDLKDFTFDYAILDEAQAIKNPTSESAKAARLVRASHRLAMSGTPIENHLGELLSLFEFLNPGMMGGVSARTGIALRNPDPETRSLLARAVRPLVLRRTKDQVVKELPEKSEQTIFCELDAAQRKQYNDLRDYYRMNLLGKMKKNGLGKSKMQILEALLRLRQAACHPGLIDKKRADEPCAKFETLLPRLEEVMEEGHKALVFSQFTSLLALLRSHLDASGTKYEYLDGKTKDRQACVDHFQQDPECKLFLISLKAGGVGLNLTAADYVFLLDPWWNPAVEAQAIDRTHRIGQTRPVFAYRLIAKDTVEEKVLELQKSKRELADSIISEDNRLIADLKSEDLELLFS